MIISLPNTPWFYRALQMTLMTLVAWLSAGFLWLLFEPSPTPPAAAPIKGNRQGPTLNMQPLTALFSEAPASGSEEPSSLSVKLRGVIAAHDDKPAVAIFEGGDPNNSAVPLGGELESGVRLVEIQGDHIIVDNRGRRERLELDAKPAANIDTNATPPSLQGNPLVRVLPSTPQAMPAPGMALPPAMVPPPSPQAIMQGPAAPIQDVGENSRSGYKARAHPTKCDSNGQCTEVVGSAEHLPLNVLPGNLPDTLTPFHAYVMQLASASEPYGALSSSASMSINTCAVAHS